MYLGTLIWISLNICFQTGSKESEGRDQKQEMPSWAQHSFPIHRSSVLVVESPLRESPTLNPPGVWWCCCVQELLWSVRIFSNGEASSMRHRKEQFNISKSPQMCKVINYCTVKPMCTFALNPGVKFPWISSHLNLRATFEKKSKPKHSVHLKISREAKPTTTFGCRC